MYLMGSLSPLSGIGPEQLKVERSLLARLADGEVEEVILATNPNVEGEATAIYLVEAHQTARCQSDAHRDGNSSWKRARLC